MSQNDTPDPQPEPKPTVPASSAWKTILALLVSILLGSGGVAVGRYAMSGSDPAPTDDTGKLIVAGFQKLDGTLSTVGGKLDGIAKKLDGKPVPPTPPGPTPPPVPDSKLLPAEVVAIVGRMTIITANCDQECKWLIPPGTPCDFKPAGASLIITPIAPTTFPLGVVCDGEVAWTIVKAGGPAPPIPPEPKPPTPPEPKPPTPPVPPIPPAPTNPLTLKLQAAYSADPSAANIKAGQKSTLQGLYEAMVDHTMLKKPKVKVDDPDEFAILTTTDLLADLKTVSGQLVPSNALVEMRKVISAEIATALGIKIGAKLDPDLRGKAVDVFAKIAKSLSEVK